MPGYREKALSAHGAMCSECRFDGEDDNPIEVHHRDGYRTNNAPGNLQVLCRSCHRAIHAELRALYGDLRTHARSLWDGCDYEREIDNVTRKADRRQSVIEALAGECLDRFGRAPSTERPNGVPELRSVK